MSKGLRILTPITVTEPMLVSSTVAEADASAWSASTTYAIGDQVMVQHGIYKSLIASNLNKPPAVNTTAWVFVRATNRWRMFDLGNSTQTAQAASMAYVLRPGVKVTHIAAVNVTGLTSFRVQAVSDAYGLVFDKTLTQERRIVKSGWWQFFFGQRQTTLQVALLEDLPPFFDLTITITITGQTDLAVGSLLLGKMQEWGRGIQYGVSLGINDHSVKKTNEFGDVQLTQRGYSRTRKLSLLLDNKDLDAFDRAMVPVRATPCLWILSDLYESLMVFGYYQTYEPVISYPSHSDCQITIEGLA